ncbi:Nnf1 [Metarhizium album ARSEF 1941]|uniref:Nnf1 n=1 Tax=Metarhizium album (strain ARSEF 1941) TaxID=1081103 RepID=A0A0B2X1Q6_METAS|nr:Nnf1 [Metarhizium album ARSEF 1941]KHN99612.1 Nnf1 [Metarhizium album ARSEF 1941]
MAAEPDPERTAQPERAREDEEDEGEKSKEEEAQAEAARPGPRALRLHQVYAASLARTLDSLSYENMAPCYPTIARRASPVLRRLQAQMVERLREKCEREFGAILGARDVVRRVNELEALAADAEARRGPHGAAAPPTPPHLLPPGEVLAAHLAPRLAEQRGLLNARLQTTQAQNALLADHVRAQRGEIDALLERLAPAVDDVRSANGVLGPLVGDLAAEARAVDAETGTGTGTGGASG